MTTTIKTVGVPREISKGWEQLGALLDEAVPGKVAMQIRRCVQIIVRDETSAADAASARATDLMMQGEVLRDQMKLSAILHEAYDHLARPSDAPPLRHVAATPQKIDALALAIGNLVGMATEAPLVELLREIAPDSPVLARLDAVDRSYVEEGTWTQPRHSLESPANHS